MNFNIQRFAAGVEPVKGKSIIYLVRPYSKRAEEAAKMIAFQTEGSRTMSKDADSVATKDGTIRVPGQGEVEISVTSLVTANDGVREQLESSMESDELMEIWEVYTSQHGVGKDASKFKSRYHQGYLTSLELSAGAEDFAELSQTYSINGMGVVGDVTLTQEQQDMIQYVFADITQASVAA